MFFVGFILFDSDEQFYNRIIGFFDVKTKLKYAEISGDSITIATTKHRFGDAYRDINNYDKALQLYLDTLTFRKTLPRKERFGLVPIKYWSVIFQQNKLSESLQYYKKALKIFEDIKLDQYATLMLSYTGDIYFETGKLDYAKQAIENEE